MAAIPQSRILHTGITPTPFRTKRPATDKIIFLSCEGSVTEEEYFRYISEMFDELKTKIQFVSVMEELDKCDNKGYKYAISNPFFEVWLLLHHDEPTEEDKQYAVTPKHEYEKTSHYRERLRELKVPMHGNANKNIRKEDYTREKVYAAVKRAEKLHIDRSDRYPEYFATTVYQLLNKIIELLSVSK